MKRSLANKWMACLVTLTCCVVLVRCRYSLTITWGPSMEPSFKHGTLLLVDRWSYRDTPPARSEIVVTEHKGELLVKRIVGVPGEHVSIHQGTVTINGLELTEEYTSKVRTLEITGGIVKENHFAVVGDNRDTAVGKLIHAVVSQQQIVGEVVWSSPAFTFLFQNSG